MISTELRAELEQLLGTDVEFDASMSRCTSMRVGGPADALAQPRDHDQLAKLLMLARAHEAPVSVIGEGFNTVVTDDGLDGIALKLARFRRLEQTDDTTIEAEAGVRHASITRFCVDANLAGLEFAAGIPGTVGGWLAMNAGIGLREMKDATLAIQWMSADGIQTKWTKRDELDFRYRALRGLPDGAVLLAARFEVEPAEPGAVKTRVDEHNTKRALTQPVHVPSCGSVFRNPEGDFAGRLIESAGLKGMRVGGAHVSSIHANFIVTEAGARASDVTRLIDAVRDAVQADSGIQLETEVKIIGRRGREARPS